MDLTVAVGEASSPLHGGSPRLGSVWNRDGQRKSPDATSAMRKSVSSSLATPTAEVNKRRAAAEFIKHCTGLDVPYSNDLNFRQALRDGVILCETLNKVLPDAIKVDTREDAGPANVQAFLALIGETLRFPSEARFSLQDLQSEDYDDRPRVVDCILLLKKIHSGQECPGSAVAGFMLREASDVQGVRDSPRKSMDLVAALSQQQQRQQQTQMSMVLPTGSRAIAATQQSANLAVFYNDLSRTLLSRMAPGAQPTPKYDHIVTNVMEQFLNGLTIEYERRLLAKDQELNGSKEMLARLTKQQEALQQQLDSISSELEDSRRKEVDRLTQASQERLQQLEDELEDTRRRLEESSTALAEAQERLGSHDDVRERRIASLEAQLAESQRQLQICMELRQRFNDLREENKRMYNQIQDLKGSIRVFCRVRPLGATGDSSHSCLDVGMDGELAVYDKAGERKVYRFDRVFGGDTTQEFVYEDVQTLIRSVMDGFNVCIFAYGQTGSGKTHTMTGSHVDDMAGRGINYRALDDLFALQAQREHDVSYEIRAQMLEIYNETIRDLLTEEQGASNRLDLLSTQPSGQNVPGATQMPVRDTAEVVAMMHVGARNRHSAETRMNERSSRSHQVLTIIVDGTNLVTGARSHACLHLVDLAGSERTDKSGVEGDRLREANSINTSLSALGNVMNSLASKSKHIPFRNSKLTELLADSLSGQAKVAMLMHVAPEGSSYGETISTLNFGNRVASVTLGQAKCNIESGKVFEAHEAVAKKDRVIAELREQLHQQGAASQRQLQEQAAIIQSLRAEVARLGGDASMPSVERAESYRTSNSHQHFPADSAASTPISMFRGRTATTTPRTQGAFGQAEQTPRSVSQRSPGPVGLHGVPRNTPRGSAFHSSTMLSQEPITGALVEHQDRLGPLQAPRGSRGAPHPAGASSTGVLVAGKPTGAATGRQLPPPIPRIDVLATKPVIAPSGSMSARPSSRHAGSAAPNATAATSPTMAAAARRSSTSANSLGSRPATSRSGTMYGSTGSLSSTLSLVLPQEPTSARGSKPPLSSRPSTGWK